MKTTLKLLLVLAPPIILAWPFLDSIAPFPKKANLRLDNNAEIMFNPISDKEEGSKPIEPSDTPHLFNISGASGQFIGKDLFSRIFKLDIQPMPVELCIKNRNWVIDAEGNKIDTNTLLNAEQVGAISIKYTNLVDGVEENVYTKLGEEQCRLLPSVGVNLSKSIEVRNPIPLDVKVEGDVVRIEENNNRRVVMNRQFGYYQIHWQWSVFLTNLFILIFGWWVFISSTLAIWKYIFQRKKNILSEK